MRSIFLGKVDNFSRKILTIFERKYDSFARKCDDFCKKIWRFFQENPPTITGKFNGFSKELRQFLHKSLMVITGTFDDFCSKICWFLFPASPHVFYHNNSHPSKTHQILLQKSSNFLVKIAKFSWRICLIFLQTRSNFSTITYRQIFL